MRGGNTRDGVNEWSIPFQMSENSLNLISDSNELCITAAPLIPQRFDEEVRET